jgi:hypothetical protein
MCQLELKSLVRDASAEVPPRLQQLPKLLDVELGPAKDGPQGAWRDVLAGMHRHCRTPRRIISVA